MATNYPTSLDTSANLPNPTGTSFQNNPDHGQQHANANDAIKALEAKLGIGNTAPSSTGLLLVPTGPGTTAWSQLTSAQLAATLTDETGTGSAVFSNTPTLVTPKVDTINENTLNNGVTVGGVNLKAGLVSLTGIPVLDATKLSTSAITLGYVQITTVYAHTTNNNVATQIPGLSLTVTIPSGGRRIRVTFYTDSINSTSGINVIRIWDGPVLTGTAIGQANSASINNFVMCPVIINPSAGSKTYNVSVENTSNVTHNVDAATTAPAYLLVEAI